jgi:hypothetical protein
MGGVDRDWLFRELRRSVALLAADGATALAGVPDGCCKADELALDFDNFQSAVVGNFAAELPAELVAALTDVDAALDAIRGDGWSEEAVRSAPEWAAVRERAGAALGLLDRFQGTA